jgi:hypothetical protein
VAHLNPHSMRGCEAFGMKHIADFEHDGRGYALLIFPIPPAGRRRPGGSASKVGVARPGVC